MATSGSFDHIPQAIQAIHNGTVVAVRRAAKQVRDDASQYAPRDTGYLSESVYTVTSDASTYGQATGKARSRADREPLPEVNAPQSDTEGVVAVAAQYGTYVEHGTSRAGAQPYLTPAAEGMRGQLGTIVAQEINRAIKAALGG